MPFALDRNKVRKHLENFDLRPLFIEELGWDHGGSDTLANAHIGNLLGQRYLCVEPRARRRPAAGGSLRHGCV